ncbi:microtubule-associated protein futsch-like [Spea bombifrons]|uniref:microtubule-associated protein futsch-like n=1 Tax=Spea bombifrons TaxID=233779 RepID=UPI00234BF0D9|nr:microtubule-associated protein futsch-like [Spea bombifrons]
MESAGDNKKTQKDRARRHRDKKHRKRARNVKGPEETAGRHEGKDTFMVSLDNFMDKRRQSLEDSLLHAETGKTGTEASIAHYDKENTGQGSHDPTPTSDIGDESHDQCTASDVRDGSLDNAITEEFDTSSGEEDVPDDINTEAFSNEEEEAGGPEKENVFLGLQKVKEMASEDSEDWETASEENAMFEEMIETVGRNTEMTEADNLPFTDRAQSELKETQSGHLEDKTENKNVCSEESDTDKKETDTEVTCGEAESIITETGCGGEGTRYSLNSREEVREVVESGEAVREEADSGVTVREVARSGVAVREEADSGVADSGVGVREEADSGVAVREEADSGVAVREEADSGVAVREEADSGVAVREEADSGVAVREEVDSGVGVREEADSGVAVREEADSGVAVREEVDSGVGVREEVDSGVGVREEADSGVAVREEAVREETDSGVAVREEVDSGVAVREEEEEIESDSKKTSRKELGKGTKSEVTFGEKMEADKVTVWEKMEANRKETVIGEAEASYTDQLRGEDEAEAKKTDRCEAQSKESFCVESMSESNMELGVKTETALNMTILDMEARIEAEDKKTVGEENQNQGDEARETFRRKEDEAKEKVRVEVEVKETVLEEVEDEEMLIEEAKETVGEKVEADIIREETKATETVWEEMKAWVKEMVREEDEAEKAVRKKREAEANEMVREETVRGDLEPKEVVREDVEAKVTVKEEGETKEMIVEEEEAKEMVKEETETEVKETVGEKAESKETNTKVVANKDEETVLQQEITITGYKETSTEDSRIWTNEVSSGYEINQSAYDNIDSGETVTQSLETASDGINRTDAGSEDDINARDILSHIEKVTAEIEAGEEIIQKAEMGENTSLKVCEEEETATLYSKNDCQLGDGCRYLYNRDITGDKEGDSEHLDQLAKQSVSQEEKDDREGQFTLWDTTAEIVDKGRDTDHEEELLLLDNQVGNTLRSNLETTGLQEGRLDQDIASGMEADIQTDLTDGEREHVKVAEMESKREDQHETLHGEGAESVCQGEDMPPLCRKDSQIANEKKMDTYGKETPINVGQVSMEGKDLLHSEGEKEGIDLILLRQKVDETDFQKQKSANEWVQEDNGEDRGPSLSNVLTSATSAWTGLYGQMVELSNELQSQKQEEEDVVLGLSDEHLAKYSQFPDPPRLLIDPPFSSYEGEVTDPQAAMQRDTESAGKDLSATSESELHNLQRDPSESLQETDRYQTASQEGERMFFGVRTGRFPEMTVDDIQLETVDRLQKKDDLSEDQVLDEGSVAPNAVRQQSNAVIDDSQELRSSRFPVDGYSDGIPSTETPSVYAQQSPSLLSAALQPPLLDAEIGEPAGSSAPQTVLEDDDGDTYKEPDVNTPAGKTQSEGKFTFSPTQIFNPILLLSQSPEESGFYSEGKITDRSTKGESHCLHPEDGLTRGADIRKSGSLLHSNENRSTKQPSGPPASPLWLPPRPSRYVGDTGAYSKATDSKASRPLDNHLIRRATIRHKKGSYSFSGQDSKRHGSTFPPATQGNSKGIRIISPVPRTGTKAPASGSPQSGTLTRQEKINEESESAFGQTGNKPFLEQLPEEELIGKQMGPKSSESIVLRVKRPGGPPSESEALRSMHRRRSKFINSSSLLYQEYSDVALNQEIQRQDSPSEERDPGSPRLRRRALSSQESYLQRLSVSSADSLWQDIPLIRGSSVFLSMTRDEQKLQEAKFELIMSEVLYLRSLNIAVDHFLHSTEMQEVLGTQERQWLFSRLSEVRDASSDFLFDLEEEFENNMYNFQVCNVVISHEPNFRRVYLPYVTNQTYQERTYQKLMTDNPRFQQVLAKLESDPVCQRLSLKSFLILPFQRITRLRLLLQNILKRSAPGSNEELQATEAHNALEKLIRDCNESVHRMKNTEDLILLNQKIQFECKIFPLISQSRRLVKHGEVSSLEFNSLSSKWKVTTRPVYLHLFNDCLLLSRLREGGRFVVFDYAHASDVRVERCEMKLHGNQKNVFRVFLRDSAAGARETSGVGRESAQEGREIEYIFRTETQSQKLRWILALSPPKEETDFLKYHGLSQMQCLKSYKSRENDELSLDKADIIMMTQRSEDGWLHGVRLSDMQSGWFPESHVQSIGPIASLRNLEEKQRLQTARAKLQPYSAK